MAGFLPSRALCGDDFRNWLYLTEAHMVELRVYSGM